MQECRLHLFFNNMIKFDLHCVKVGKKKPPRI